MKPLSFLFGLLTICSGLTVKGQSPSCVAPPPGIVAWWPGESNAVDTNNGTWVGHPSYTVGEVGQAFNFDGASYVQVPASPNLDISTNSGFTLEAKKFVAADSSAFTYDKTSGIAKLYVNGVVVGSQNFGNITPATSYPAYHVNIGSRYAAYYYTGAIDEVSVYGRALSQSEIQSIFNAGSAGKMFGVSDGVTLGQTVIEYIAASS